MKNKHANLIMFLVVVGILAMTIRSCLTKPTPFRPEWSELRMLPEYGYYEISGGVSTHHEWSEYEKEKEN